MLGSVTGDSRQVQRIHIGQSSEVKPTANDPAVLKPRMTSLAADLGRCREEGDEENGEEASLLSWGSNEAGMFGTGQLGRSSRERQTMFRVRQVC